MEYIIRIQTRSEEHPELDGAYFRAFDYEKWEAWGSDADIGWGAWSVETGWTQSWITTVTGMRLLNTTLWDLGATLGVPKYKGGVRGAGGGGRVHTHHAHGTPQYGY